MESEEISVEAKDMDAEENVVWDTPENAKLDEMILLATQTGVPRQVVDCLLECGFDSVERVAILRDVGEIEVFYRENSFLYTEPEKRQRLYGLFEKNPEKFVFLPGHRSSLQHFVTVCLHSLPEDSHAAVAAAATAVSVTSAATTSGATTVTAVEDAIRTSSSTRGRPIRNSVARAGSSTGSNAAASSVSATAVGIMQEMKRKFHKWCSTHPDAHVKQLQLGRDFRINILCSRDVNDEDVGTHPLPLSLFGVEIVCMVCAGKVRLNARQNSFVSSNATRHLYRCARGLVPKRGKGRRGGRRAPLSMRQKQLAADDDAVMQEGEKAMEDPEEGQSREMGEEEVEEKKVVTVEVVTLPTDGSSSSLTIGDEVNTEVVEDETEPGQVVEDETEHGQVIEDETEPEQVVEDCEQVAYAIENAGGDGIHTAHFSFETTEVDGDGHHNTVQAVFTVAGEHDIVDGELYFIDESNQLRKLNAE